MIAKASNAFRLVFPQTWIRPIALLLSGIYLGCILALPTAADELRLRAPQSSQGPASNGVSGPASGPSFEDERILLPDIGSSAGNLMTPAAERRLGARFMASVRENLPVIEEPLLSDYIQQLGHNLAEKSDYPGRPFTFFIIDQPVVNAFAGPGGYIGVNAGLILEARSESELASVMAHEIAHVTQNHLFRAFEKAQRMSGPAAIMLLGAILLGAAVGGDAGIAAAAGVQAGVVQNQVNFTRSNEKEADRVGIKTLAKSGFDPRAMPLFFERLAQASRLYENNAPEFLRTHPVTTDRIADSLGRAEQYPRQQARDELRFSLVQAALRARQYESPAQAIKHFKSRLADKRQKNKDAQRYGYALALMDNRDYSLARTQIDKLLRGYPQQKEFIIAGARLDQLAGNEESALQALQTGLKMFPESYPLTMAYAETLLDLGKPEKAEEVLQDQILLLPDNANLYRLLARVSGETGDLVAAHQYQAEYYYLSYELEAAVQQLEIALRGKNISFYESSRLEARLNEIKLEQQALKREEF